MITLGIETSCDETALALIETRGTHTKVGDNSQHTEYRIIQSLVHSQAELHSAYGGVFPTLAKREHSKNLVPLLEKILNDLPVKKDSSGKECRVENFKDKLDSFKNEYGEQNSDLLESFVHAHYLERIPDIDRIAVTEGPGLEPALWVGIIFARLLGELWNIPVIPVDHMEGHVIGSLLDDEKPYGTWQPLKYLETPAVALLISGGHTELIKIENNSPLETSNLKISYTLLGKTVDDAVGEAFDKTARLLGLPYPGGPHISKLAHEAWEQKIESPVKLPRPMINSGDLNFSFSGLKTAVLYAVREAQENGTMCTDKTDTEQSINFKKGLAYGFEQSVVEVLNSKLQQAIEDTGAQAVIIGGGVSANHVLRTNFKKIAEKYHIPLFLPSFHVSGDNALMIALVGSMKNFDQGNFHQSSKTIRALGTKKIAE
jgi:N6-L-threonylcarbamoyladenine synthase